MCRCPVVTEGSAGRFLDKLVRDATEKTMNRSGCSRSYPHSKSIGPTFSVPSRVLRGEKPAAWFPHGRFSKQWDLPCTTKSWTNELKLISHNGKSCTKVPTPAEMQIEPSLRRPAP